MSGTNAFKVGYKFFKQGRTDCPFDDNTYFAREWLRGWNRAYFNSLDSIKKSPRPDDLRDSSHSCNYSSRL